MNHEFDYLGRSIKKKNMSCLSGKSENPMLLRFHHPPRSPWLLLLRMLWRWSIIFAGEVSSEQIMQQIQSLARKSIITQLLVGPKILPKYHSWCRLHSFFQASHCSLGGFSSTFSSRAFGSLRVARDICFSRDLNTDWWLLSQNLAEIWHEIWPAKLVETRWIRCFEY